MKVDYLSRFDRAFKKLETSPQRRIKSAIHTFLDHLESGMRPHGLGLRRLRGAFWEIRVGLDYRVLFELKKDWITFIFCGDHDGVRRFLKDL